MKSMEIPEGSKVIFKLKGVGEDTTIKECEASSNIKVEPNAVILIDNGLFCTDSFHPIVKDGEVYVINVWIQDAYCVKNDTFYQSVSDGY